MRTRYLRSTNCWQRKHRFSILKVRFFSCSCTRFIIDVFSDKKRRLDDENEGSGEDTDAEREAGVKRWEAEVDSVGFL